MAFWWPSRRPGASAFGMRCSRRRSTRRSCLASARSSTRGLLSSSRAVERPGAAELAPHWAAAGRAPDAFVASVEAARQAEAVFGLAEAHAHVERALALWETVPNPVELVRLDLAEL